MKHYLALGALLVIFPFLLAGASPSPTPCERYVGFRWGAASPGKAFEAWPGEIGVSCRRTVFMELHTVEGAYVVDGLHLRGIDGARRHMFVPVPPRLLGE